MNLYIRINNGQTIEHPILEDNLLQAFPGIDINNLPEGFAKFKRTPYPTIGVYEVYESTTYEWDGEAYTEVHHVRPMTNEERQHAVANAELLRPGPNWTLDLETLKWTPPPLPTTGGPWKFDSITAKDWVLAPNPPFPSWVLREDGLVWKAPVEKPNDGARYRWNEQTLSWIAF